MTNAFFVICLKSVTLGEKADSQRMTSRPIVALKLNSLVYFIDVKLPPIIDISNIL
jgi:hypothetical protein